MDDTLNSTSTFSPTELTKVLEKVSAQVAREPPCLLPVDGTPERSLLELHPGETTIGRHPENTHLLDQDGVSRHHFKLTVDADFGQVTCEDLGSRNGTWVNSERLTGPVILQRDDLIQAGRVVFRFLPFGAPERYTYQRLREDSQTDSLTGCFNKGFFNSAMERAFRRFQGGQEGRLALILFDLDHFKRLNDQFGHDAGDQVLKGVAKLVQSLLPGRGEFLARYGGEEFVVLLPGASLTVTRDYAEYFRLHIAEHEFYYDNQRLPVTISMGVGAVQQGFKDGIALFRAVDAALYQSKEGGRNRVSVAREPQ